MIDEKRLIQTKMQDISLSKKTFDGKILDVGGGGEGFIGLLYGQQCVSIDLSQEELDEAQNDAEKIVMDACKLDFDDKHFACVTFFYSLMYMSTEDKIKALSESIRVLKSGGTLEIWDTEIPEYDGSEKDVFLTHLNVSILDKSIETTYGVGLSQKEQTLSNICDIVKSLGATTSHKAIDNSAFYISALK